VIQQQLSKTTAQKFLESYHTNIFSKPKILLIGSKEHIHSKKYDITRSLPYGATPAVVAKELSDIIALKN
jgi:hypothetical protein